MNVLITGGLGVNGAVTARLMVNDGLRPVFWWDRLYLGGGNSRQITPAVLDRLGDDVVVVPNSAALVGGARAWDLPPA